MNNDHAFDEDFGNLEAAARVSILGAVTLGWRKAGSQSARAG